MTKPKCCTAVSFLLTACAASLALPAAAQDAPVAGSATPDGYAQAEQAYRLFEAKSYPEAIVYAREAVERAPQNQAYRALLAQSYFANHDWLDAAESFRIAADLPSNADVDRGYLLRARVLSLVYASEMAPAKSALREGLADPDAASSQRFDWSMVAIAARDDRAAQAILDDESLYGQFTRQTALDAGYSAKRAMMDERAVRFFTRGLELDEAEPSRLDATTRLSVAREISLLSRRWVASGQVSYGDSERQASFLNLPSPALANIQAGGEIGYRLGGWRNGRPITPFVRVFQTSYLSSSVVGQDATQGWIGIQHKPFRALNLVLEASKLIDLGGPALDDWSVRAAFSESRGVEPEALRRSWPVVDLYADMSQLLSSGHTFGLANVRLGYAFTGGNSPGPLVITPFLVTQASYESARSEEFALGSGVGVSVRKWLTTASGNPARSYIDLSVQGRVRIAGDDRAQGIFATLSFGL